MKRLLKIAAVLAVLFAVLTGVASIALHFLLPPEKLKQKVLEQLTARLHREVRVEAVSLNILSGLSLSNLQVSEAPDFSKGTFVSSERFRLRLALVPLLFRKVMVDEFLLDHPVIHITRELDGKTFNFSDLTEPVASTSPVTANSTAASPATSNNDIPLTLLVSQTDISHGQIIFIDKSPAKQSATIDDLTLRVKNASLVTPFNVQASLNLVARHSQATLHFVGEASLPTASAKIKSLSFTSGKSAILLSGNAKNLRTQPTVDLKLEIKEFDLNALRPLIEWPAGVRSQGPLTGNGYLQGDQKKMEVGLVLDASAMDLQYASSFKKPVKTPMALSLHGTLANADLFSIKDLGLNVGQAKLLGHGTVSSIATSQPVVSMHFDSNAIDVQPLAAMAPGLVPSTVRLKGQAKLSADISGTAMSAGFKAKMDGSALSVAMADQAASKPAGLPTEIAVIGDLVRPNATTQIINFQSLSGQVGHLRWDGAGSYVMRGTSGQINLAIKTNRFPLGEAAALAPAAAIYKPTGTALVDAKISGSPSAPLVNGSLSLEGVGAKIQESSVASVAGNVTFSAQDVLIPKLTGKLNGGDFTISLTGHALQTQPSITVDGNVANLDLDKLLPPVPQPAKPAAPTARVPWIAVANAAVLPSAPSPTLPLKTSGHLVVGKVKHELYQGQNLDLTWSLRDVTPDLSRVSGNAAFRQGEGKLQNVEKLAQQSRFARILLFPIDLLQKIQSKGSLKDLHLPTLQTFPFNGIRGDYAMEKGVMTIQNFELLGRDLELSTQGTVGMAGVQNLNLKGKARLTAGLIGGTVGQLLQDSSGRVSIGFIITGTVDDPKVRPEFNEATKKAAQQLGNQLLKGLGLGAPPAPSQNAAPADGAPPVASNAQDSNQNQPAPDPAKELQKALKNIFH